MKKKAPPEPPENSDYKLLWDTFMAIHAELVAATHEMKRLTYARGKSEAKN